MSITSSSVSTFGLVRKLSSIAPLVQRLYELAGRKDFIKLMADIEIYVDAVDSIQE